MAKAEAPDAGLEDDQRRAAVGKCAANRADARRRRRGATAEARDADAQSANGRCRAMGALSSQSAGRRARTWLRFAHTGEVYGLAGQTVAGLVTAGGAVLVLTGIALALRRFLSWRKRARGALAKAA